MHQGRIDRSRRAVLCLLIVSSMARAATVDPEDQKLIDAADCATIVKEHGNYLRAERKVADEIRATSNSTVATNVLGAATLATFGLGFFTWDDQVDARENLAELTAYREAIEAAGRRKGCAMGTAPASR